MKIDFGDRIATKGIRSKIKEYMKDIKWHLKNAGRVNGEMHHSVDELINSETIEDFRQKSWF